MSFASGGGNGGLGGKNGGGGRGGDGGPGGGDANKFGSGSAEEVSSSLPNVIVLDVGVRISYRFLDSCFFFFFLSSYLCCRSFLISTELFDDLDAFFLSNPSVSSTSCSILL